VVDSLTQIVTGTGSLGLPAQAAMAVSCLLIGAKLVMSMYEQFQRISDKRNQSVTSEPQQHQCGREHCQDHDSIQRENFDLKAKVVALEVEQGQSKTLINMMQKVMDKIDGYSEQLFDRMRAVETGIQVHTSQIAALVKRDEIKG
jgi:hypothetical protein